MSLNTTLNPLISLIQVRFSIEISKVIRNICLSSYKQPENDIQCQIIDVYLNKLENMGRNKSQKTHENNITKQNQKKYKETEKTKKTRVMLFAVRA